MTSFLSYANDLCRRACVRFAHYYYSTANATGSTVAGAIMLDLSAASETCSFVSTEEISDGRIVEIRAHRISILTISRADRSRSLSLSCYRECSMSPDLTFNIWSNYFIIRRRCSPRRAFTGAIPLIEETRRTLIT